MAKIIFNRETPAELYVQQKRGVRLLGSGYKGRMHVEGCGGNNLKS